MQGWRSVEHDNEVLTVSEYRLGSSLWISMENSSLIWFAKFKRVDERTVLACVRLSTRLRRFLKKTETENRQ